MAIDRWHLFHQMVRSRQFEVATKGLWDDGLISGELHLGLGEEGIVAGVVCQLEDGDAMALDHRGTPPFVMRGIDLNLLLLEMLGSSEGLCRGMGGHMHLFSQEHLVASSGIVGAAAPTAVGFALSAQQLRPNAVAVAFFGEGAMNQGMVMESLNLAVVWDLPVIFVCKDNNWAITTHSDEVTGGDLKARAASFGMEVLTVDGADVEAVWKAAEQAIARARHGGGPTFLLATCTHLEGHFLGDPMLHIARHPLRGMVPYAPKMTKSAVSRQGGSIRERVEGVLSVIELLGKMTRDHRWKKADPVERLRRKLLGDPERLTQIEAEVTQEITEVVSSALQILERRA